MNIINFNKYSCLLIVISSCKNNHKVSVIKINYKYPK